LFRRIYQHGSCHDACGKPPQAVAERTRLRTMGATLEPVKRVLVLHGSRRRPIGLCAAGANFQEFLRAFFANAQLVGKAEGLRDANFFADRSDVRGQIRFRVAALLRGGRTALPGDDRKPELAEPTQDAGEAPFHGFEKWQRAAPPLREHREEWPEEKSEHRRGPQSILEGWQERRFLRASLFRFLRFQIRAPPPCFL